MLGCKLLLVGCLSGESIDLGTDHNASNEEADGCKIARDSHDQEEPLLIQILKPLALIDPYNRHYNISHLPDDVYSQESLERSNPNLPLPGQLNFSLRVKYVELSCSIGRIQCSNVARRTCPSLTCVIRKPGLLLAHRCGSWLLTQLFLLFTLVALVPFGCPPLHILVLWLI